MDNKKLLEIFAVRLRDVMSEKGITRISDLAAQTDIPRTTISNWLNLVRSPQIDSLVVLARFFGVRIDYLLGLEDL